MQNKSMIKRPLIWLMVILVFLLSSYFLSPNELKVYPDYVSHSPSPSGLKALYTYLDNEEKTVDRWTKSPLLLTEGNDNEPLVMVEPFFIPEKELMESYKSFMESGNTILLMKENPKGMFDINTFYEEEMYLSEEVSTIDTENRSKYNAEIQTSFVLQVEEQDEILLSNEFGTIGLKRPIGQGQLIVVNAPNWLTNESLLDYNHIDLIFYIFNEINPSTYLFDEYTHGEQNASSILTIYPMWFILLMIQGTIFSVYFLWYRGKRFGAIIVPREEKVRFSDEGIKVIAVWYLEGRRYKESLEIQSDYFKGLLQERWGIRYSDDWDALTERIGEKWKCFSKNDLTSFLKGLSSVLEKETINKKEYLLWSKKLEQLRKEVEER